MKKYDILNLNISTPCYFYDMDLLNKTLDSLQEAAKKHDYLVHYALKANYEEPIVKEIASRNLGADCVSGGEVDFAIKMGFEPSKIVYAGVGKTPLEIKRALQIDIACFNVESIEELDMIQQIAERMNKTATVALRINPDIDAHTHHYITTGLAETKFGISLPMFDLAVKKALELPNIKLAGLHFHIGSQITLADPYRLLSVKASELVAELKNKFQFTPEYINLGGGLGIDYDNPDNEPVADFSMLFDTVSKHLDIDSSIKVHFELGRSIVAQCGTLLASVIYVKNGVGKRFIIVDAGMNDLIRPALYEAHHKIENLTADLMRPGSPVQTYDVVGPICESSDCFDRDLTLPVTQSGDLIAIRSAGAYGSAMSSTYNMRQPASRYFFETKK
ncbi:MAG: diaminopimelate decarboxylase [Muribaculaceae bacterium]|nr:diaminopimelate decarboxylase [Muribaculaceae bacterium]